MKYILLCLFTCGLLCSEELIEQQIKWNVEKALLMHNEFLTQFHETVTMEYEKWEAQSPNEAEKTKLKMVLAEMNEKIQTICSQKKQERDEIVEKESKQYIDTFKEIKEQGTPEKMLVQRANSLGHNIFHILQKIYETERHEIMDTYLQNLEKMMSIAKCNDISTTLEQKKKAFTLEENIKMQRHNVVHSFQILNELEFTEEQKNWVLDRLYIQVEKQERERERKKDQFWKMMETYFQEQEEEFMKQELTEEDKKQMLDKQTKVKALLKKLHAEFAERLGKYEKDLIMFSQRRMSNLQREIYYFKSFIDGEIERYKNAKFPETIIAKFVKRHWEIFLEMTDTNLKRWTEEDTILFTRHLVTELGLCEYDKQKIEALLLEHFFE